MKNLTILFLVLMTFSCRPDSDRGAEDRAAFKEVQLICEDQGMHDGIPKSAVYAILKDNKVKLADIHHCEAIGRESYANNRIPEDALFAVGGSGGDHTEYVYARVNKEDENELRFYIDMQEGESTHGAVSALATYKNGKFQVLRPLHLADIAGYYMHQGKDTSYVLFLGLKGPQLVSKLFATDEPLPAQKMLQRALPEFASTPDLEFDCELNTLIFHSALGDGSVYWRPDSAAVIFDPFMDKPEKAIFELIQF